MEIDKIIKLALDEDIGSGDATTLSTIPEDKKAEALIKAKDDGILCGIDIARKIFKKLDADVKIIFNFKDGDIIRKRDIIAEVHGSARALLTSERTVLNFLQRLSGIATTANKYSEIIKPYGVRLLDTRKTSPLLRPLEKYAVKTGGGINHRFGLFDMILIKDNHIKISGSIKLAVSDAKKMYPDLKVEVETENLDMVKEALDAGADRIMLDNMDTRTMKKAVDIIAGKAEIEASGGITIENILDVAKTGVGYISIGSALTNVSKTLDISMDIKV